MPLRLSSPLDSSDPAGYVATAAAAAWTAGWTDQFTQLDTGAAVDQTGLDDRC